MARLPHYVQTYNVYIYIYLHISLYIHIYHHRSPVVYSMTSSSSYTGCVIWNWRPLRARDPVLAPRSSRSRNGIYHRISQRIVYHGICNGIIIAMYIYIYISLYVYSMYLYIYILHYNIYIYRYPTYFIPISIWHWPDHEWQCRSNQWQYFSIPSSRFHSSPRSRLSLTNSSLSCSLCFLAGDKWARIKLHGSAISKCPDCS